MKHFYRTHLTVTIETASAAQMQEAIAALARSACDIANSMEEETHIIVTEEDPSGEE